MEAHMGTASRSALLGLLWLLASGMPTPAVGQNLCSDGTPELAMGMLLEKTILRVDVLNLSVRVGGEAAVRLRHLVDDGISDQERDSVALIASGATCATATLDFVRNVSLGRLLDSIRNSSRAAREAGLIGPATYDLIDTSLPDWYAFLEGRGVKDGDRMQYQMRGDTLNIRYVTATGDLLLDRTDIGAEQRRSVLAGYFAPGSDFRDGLIRSLGRSAES